VLLISSCLSIASCSKPPEYSEVEERFIELIEASYEINKVLFENKNAREAVLSLMMREGRNEGI